MGECTFKCSQAEGLYCCECNAKQNFGDCIAAKCDMACTHMTKKELEDTNWYYEEYVKPQK